MNGSARPPPGPDPNEARPDARGRSGRAGQQTRARTSLYRSDSLLVLNGRPVQIS